MTLIQTSSLRSIRTMTNVEEIEIDRRDDEDVHGGNIWSMIAQEGEPSLAWWPASLDHVFGDA